MDAHIIQTARVVEELVHCTEVDPYVPYDHLKELNEHKLLEGIKPYIKTQYFKNHDAGYMESRIWLPYIRDEMFKKLEDTLKSDSEHSARVIETLQKSLTSVRTYNNNLQYRIDNYNKLPWWKKWFTNV